MLPANINKHPAPPPLVRVAGSHRQIGQQIGEATFTAMIMDLTAGQMRVTWGNPCENLYHTYQL